MEPRIQYAKTDDGVSIAFWTMGEGEPLVSAPAMYSHIQLEWQLPAYRAYYERIAQRRRLVRYDRRGTGLSDRNVSDYSLEAQLLDLEAVVDYLDAQRFILAGAYYSGAIAIAYAARHPERVSHLLLWGAFAKGSDSLQTRQVQAQRSLIDTDWEFFAESAAQFWSGWSGGQEARQIATFIRECITPEALQRTFEALEQFDVTALLPQIQPPTLVVHFRQMPYPSVDDARNLALRIPNARLLLLEGTSILPSAEQLGALVDAFDEFLAEGDEVAAGAEPTTVGAVHTILFTDVEGSTALTQRLGDAKARELLRQHERMVREALKSHGGSEVKTMGDGFMASFSSATKALECAIAMQRAFAEHNESAEEPIKVRVGLNAGEPIAEEEDLFGTAVNLAARICAHAEAGQILAPVVVRELTAGKQFLFADLGDVALRGFEDPVRLYEISWRGQS